jgi:uncharacterized membrane protein
MISPGRPALALPWGLALVSCLWITLIWQSPVWRAASERPALSSAGTLVYSMAARLCHQRPERSFRRGAAPLPVCGRCAGLYAGSALGLLAAALARPRLWSARVYRRLAAGAAIPTVVTMVLEGGAIGTVDNLARGVAAIVVGALAGWMLGTAAGLVSGPGLRVGSPRDAMRPGASG